MNRSASSPEVALNSSVDEPVAEEPPEMFRCLSNCGKESIMAIASPETGFLGGTGRVRLEFESAMLKEESDSKVIGVSGDVFTRVAIVSLVSGHNEVLKDEGLKLGF